jgi:RNA polymerase sigma factor (sigma-70 family)
MSVGSSSAVLRDIQTLFDSGTASGLSDRQLLERFAGGRGAPAESAFEVLVLRHGPMVLQVCQNVLGNATDAQDAFQATFLVLVRRYSSIRRLDSVGGWLYGVACRVAARARVDAARRRAIERRGALRLVEAMDIDETDDASHAESSPALQAEVKRLPEKYRSVVVLCYWEGLTQEQAAAQLGCPIGTVRSRLARARDILRRRLVRRGLVPLAGFVVGALAATSTEACVAALRLSPVPGELVRSTVASAAKVAAGEAVVRVASGAVASLVQQMIWGFALSKLGRVIAACLFIGLGVVGVGLWANQPRQKRANPLPVAQPEHRIETKREASGPRKFGPAHVVEPPDLVIVEVLDALPGRPISGERLVRPDGSISLGFYGDLQIGGLTLLEAKEKIVRHLQKYLTDEVLGLVETDELGEPRIDPATGKAVMIDPTDSDAVFVDVTAYNSQNYYIQGDVHFPGKTPFTGNETVLDAIQLAGGLLPSADRSHVKLIRSYPKGSPVHVLPIDYEEVTMGTDASTNFTIMPNDRIVVPRDPNYVSTQSNGGGASFSVASPQLYYGRDAGSYFPAPEKGQERPTFQSVESSLSELEKKLDKIIERMGRAENKKAKTSSAKAARARVDIPPLPDPGLLPFSDEPTGQNPRPR